NIQKYSLHDGPGIRTTVFFKGCSLRCAWCHNPESISPKPQVHWAGTRCIGCMSCLGACPEQALTAEEGRISIDRSKCTTCLSCVNACPSTAMDVYGKVYTVDQVVKEVLKDRTYYEKSGGGVTLSGGEPTLQHVFARALLKELKQEGIHTAVDTCGQCPWENIEALLPYADLVLYDMKMIAPDPHRENTGATSTLILENLLHLASFMDKIRFPKDLWIRTPIIPGRTLDPVTIRAIGTFIREKLDRQVRRWDLCAFNNLCTHKYEELGMDWPLKTLELAGTEDMERLAAVARKVLEKPGAVFTSGPMRKNTADETKRRLSIITGGRA
ncbi:glycyl-radical enzyme activating protein, partial [bacterium]|nr:glycyl-radical enzyme activating protein [bacterium]